MHGNQRLSLPSEFQQLSTLLEGSPQTLATGNQEIHTAALHAVKYLFDTGAILYFRHYPFT